ncbi:L-fuconolactonase [Kribbella voronezhensis]|uniref:L-fuconolactonase n=1 Tax=Kribbella voronezhensis TaxID=2512212 RepID=A0A4R7T0A9_9ACTN|nr:amidohydrolase family protein [Kribbella voronezhensis]TDU84267.1 L-fuconolactonase [Kribbella voronezhensis]
MPVIDAHHHFWRVAAQEQPWRNDRHGSIARDYTPDDLRPELIAAGVDSTVLIQSVDEPAENDRLAAYAAEAPFVAAVVGWLPLSDPAAARAELERLDSPVLRGVRCLVGRDPLDWLTEPDSVALFKELATAGLSWDVVPVTAAQTAAVVALAHAVPELRIVVDHLGRPPIDSGGWEPWAGQLRQLSECPGIALKVSLGIDLLSAVPAWPSDLDRYLRWAVDCFGAQRLMLASNWPVVLLRADYQHAWNSLREVVERALDDPNELAAVLGGTAAHYYRINGKVS